MFYIHADRILKRELKEACNRPQIEIHFYFRDKINSPERLVCFTRLMWDTELVKTYQHKMMFKRKILDPNLNLIRNKYITI